METLKTAIKPFKATFLIFIMLFSISSYGNYNMEVDSYSSLVIIKVKGLNSDTFNKISQGIGKEVSLSLEYSCLQSDVIVIKYKHSFSEKGDVQHYINNKLKRWIGANQVEFIHIDMVLGGSSKC